MNSKERENLLENERNMISVKLAEINEEQNKKMLQKDIQLREDAQAKFVLLEKVRIVTNLQDSMVEWLAMEILHLGSCLEHDLQHKPWKVFQIRLC